MKVDGIDLGDPAWMCVPANAQEVYRVVSDGRCLRMNRGRRIVSRFSSSGWMRGVRSEWVTGRVSARQRKTVLRFATVPNLEMIRLQLRSLGYLGTEAVLCWR